MEKLRTRRILATAALTAIAAAFLLLENASAPVATTPLVAEVRQAPEADTATELAVMYLPDDFRVDQASVSGTPSPAPPPAVASSSPDSPPSDSEQRVFRSRRALETIDPREFLRHP